MLSNPLVLLPFAGVVLALNNGELPSIAWSTQMTYDIDTKAWENCQRWVMTPTMHFKTIIRVL